jgi:hypothetical protein
MASIRNILVSTYGRAMRKLNVARKHLPHDRLVLVCDSGDADLPTIKQNTLERGGEFIHVEVDPYDFEACLNTCYRTLEDVKPLTLEAPLPGSLKVNISCGPKTLVGAMLFAAMNAGVEVYHCDVESATGKELVIKLPTVMDFEIHRRFSSDDWSVISCLNDPREVRVLSKRTGFKDARLERVLSKLEREGILEQVMKGTAVLAKPTAIGRFYAALAPQAKERKVNPD